MLRDSGDLVEDSRGFAARNVVNLALVVRPRLGPANLGRPFRRAPRLDTLHVHLVDLLESQVLRFRDEETVVGEPVSRSKAI